ncbi:signal transduction histidine kinase [Clostridiales Family XIII bacterium PM5-7]
MRNIKILRDMLIIFSLSITLSLFVTMFIGVEYTNERLFWVLEISFSYAVLSFIFFWEWLIDKIGFLAVQIIYVVMLNAIYITFSQIEDWGFTLKGYTIVSAFTVVAFLLVRSIIFSIDKAEVDKINTILEKRRNLCKKNDI